jgi:hypothetical protein
MMYVEQINETDDIIAQLMAKEQLRAKQLGNFHIA